MSAKVIIEDTAVGTTTVEVFDTPEQAAEEVHKIESRRANRTRTVIFRSSEDEWEAMTRAIGLNPTTAYKTFRDALVALGKSTPLV